MQNQSKLFMWLIFFSWIGGHCYIKYSSCCARKKNNLCDTKILIQYVSVSFYYLLLNLNVCVVVWFYSEKSGINCCQIASFYTQLFTHPSRVDFLHSFPINLLKALKGAIIMLLKLTYLHCWYLCCRPFKQYVYLKRLGMIRNFHLNSFSHLYFDFFALILMD